MILHALTALMLVLPTQEQPNISATSAALSVYSEKKGVSS